MAGALPPWRRGLPQSLPAEALPPIALFQRLYQAVHGFKGGLEITAPQDPELPRIRKCLESLHRLAEGEQDLAAADLKSLQKLLKQKAASWESLEGLLATAKDAPPVDPAALKALEDALRGLDPTSRLDGGARARLRWAAAKGFQLQTCRRVASLAELENTDAEIESQLLGLGGLLISRSLSALTPGAKKIIAYQVELHYVGALPAGVNFSADARKTG